ncbi:bifunctional tRNA(Ile)-lysidine synthase [Babesia duncani]|uniref:tRNA(Ile)-lysidine synthetase n=1 Tax=Babesia duncani TaxID=323732 RepID=A0AAD9UMV4_9APIC|nr:bifunctional tRNA(Ile)-lysidine synthase [Babesia duncani]
MHSVYALQCPHAHRACFLKYNGIYTSKANKLGVLDVVNVEDNALDLEDVVPLQEVYKFFNNYLMPFYHKRVSQNYGTNVPIIISCSGGVDSMALLHTFGLIKENSHTFIKKHPINYIDGSNAVIAETASNVLKYIFENVNVIYFDHKVRSDTKVDIEIIENACKKYNFNFNVQELDCNDSYFSNLEGGFQANSRKWRRRELKKYVMELHSSKMLSNEGKNKIGIRNGSYNSITTNKQDGLNSNSIGIVFMGHHANDNIETFFMKFIRGTHLLQMSEINDQSFLDSKDRIPLIRPFIHLPKNALHQFMQDFRFQYNEDSTNVLFDYGRNQFRKLVMPNLIEYIMSINKCQNDKAIDLLDKRIHVLSKQASNFRNDIEFQIQMFKVYLKSKYGDLLPIKKKRYMNRMGEIYSDFYKRLYFNRYNTAIHSNIQELKYFHDLNIPIMDLFFVDEWLILESKLLREEVLYDFFSHHFRKPLFYNAFTKIVDRLEVNFSEGSIKQYCLSKDVSMSHQGSLLKVKHRPEKNEKVLIFKDDLCSFSVLDNLQLFVEKAEGYTRNVFHLLFKVPMYATTESIDFDIRLFRNDDVLPSKILWNREAGSLLTHMKIKHIIKDYIPVIAMAGTNKIVGFYGFNIIPPYHCRGRQEVTYSFVDVAHGSTEYREYSIRVTR